MPSLMGSLFDRLGYLNVFKSHVSIRKEFSEVNWTTLGLYQSIQENKTEIDEASTESSIAEVDADAVVAAEERGMIVDDAEKESIKVMTTSHFRYMISWSWAIHMIS